MSTFDKYRTALDMVRGFRATLKRSPGLGVAPFSDEGWATIEEALEQYTTSAVGDIGEAKRQIGLAHDMLKSCLKVPFSVAERDQCMGHLQQAHAILDREHQSASKDTNG